MKVDDLVGESEALGADLEALRERLQDFESRPVVEGSAAEAVRREELAEIEQAVKDIEQRSDAVHAQIKEWKADPVAALATEHPSLGWLARRSWRFGVIAAILPPLLWVAGTFIGPDRDVKLPFFEAAVQVIPILVLAAAIEGRVFQIDSYPRRAAMQAFYPLSFAVVVLGEIAALWTLGRGEATDLTFVLTVCALINAGTSLILMALIGRD